MLRKKAAKGSKKKLKTVRTRNLIVPAVGNGDEVRQVLSELFSDLSEPREGKKRQI